MEIRWADSDTNWLNAKGWERLEVYRQPYRANEWEVATYIVDETQQWWAVDVRFTKDEWADKEEVKRVLEGLRDLAMIKYAEFRKE